MGEVDCQEKGSKDRAKGRNCLVEGATVEIRWLLPRLPICNCTFDAPSHSPCTRGDDHTCKVLASGEVVCVVHLAGHISF